MFRLFSSLLEFACCAHSRNLQFFYENVVRITSQEILRRIQNAEPTYDHIQWLEDARQHETYMKNICEMPIQIGPASVQDTRRLRG